MTQAKAFAALTGGLLARKGEARPAMRSQSHQRGGSLDDLGWDELGALPRPRLARGSTDTGAIPQVVRQQVALAREFGDAPNETPADLKLRSRAKGLDDGKKAAFTLRLDAERHLKLRLACALSRRSAQTIVMDALDAHLAHLPARAPTASEQQD